MTLFTDVFERKELKYQLTASQHRRILASLLNHMELDEFGFSQVRSLYYDTPEYTLIERSLNKPRYKEKLRVRSYGIPEEGSPVFVEIKKKFEDIVYKRRVSMTLEAARAYLGGMSYDRACLQYPLPDTATFEQPSAQKSDQIAQEIDFFLEQYAPLSPSMLVVCDRSAYAALDGSELRITFDHDITSSAYADDLSSSEGCQPLLPRGEVLMEIKNGGPMPAWLMRALSSCEAYPSSFSKYGAAYMGLKDEQATLFIQSVSAVAIAANRAIRSNSHKVLYHSLASDSPNGCSAPAISLAVEDAVSANTSESVRATAGKTPRHARPLERNQNCA